MDGWGSPLSRRRLLAATASAAATAAMAGCGGTNARNNRAAAETSLGYVRVVNEQTVDHTIHVLVERDEEVVFWSSYDLSAADDDPSPLPVEGPWTDGGGYKLYFRLDEDDEWATFETGDADCYGLEVRVGDDGLGLWTEQRPDVCEESTTTE